MPSKSGMGRRNFPATRPTLLKRANTAETHIALPALNELLSLYRPALLEHLIYRLSGWKVPRDLAEDVLHDFISERILQKQILASADPKRGRFRTFLLTALDRFTVSWMRKRTAGKREPDGGFVGLQEVEGATCGEHCEGDARWARVVIDESLRRARVECEKAGQAAFWSMFEYRIVTPAKEGSKPPSYELLVARFGFRSPSEAANALLTAKRRLRRAVESVVGEYTYDREQTSREIEVLRTILEGTET